MELNCAVQKYAWGKFGSSSEVAKLAKGCSDEVIDDTKPYAELWMGTHPNGPSLVKSSQKPLAEVIREDPSVLGVETRKLFGDELPFLFKVLSVRQALSIQAHPDKKRAELLHAAHPDVYKDPNHKPEMAIALTPFTALCGFRSKEEILKFAAGIPELTEALGEENVRQLSSDGAEKALRDGFAKMMRQPKEKVESLTEGLMKRVAEPGFSEALNLGEIGALLIDMLTRIHADFPGDIGLFGVLLFNLMVLQPGEAIFLGPNVPHAYLLGDCVECMACSDNVVRAGLTPKFIDVDTLVDMLVYEFSSSDQNLFPGENLPSSSPLLVLTEYNPPVNDFTVARYELNPSSGESVSLPVLDSASVLIFIECEEVKIGLESGENVEVVPGKVIFSPAGGRVDVQSSGGRCLMFRAYVKI